MIDLLEHIEDPNSFIADLKKKHNNPNFIIISGPISTRVFHDKSDFPPHHLWWFSEKGLRSMMSNHNYHLTYKKYEKSPFLLIRNIIGRIKYGFTIREYSRSDKSFSGKSILFKMLDKISKIQFNIPLMPKYNAGILVFKKDNNTDYNI